MIDDANAAEAAHRQQEDEEAQREAALRQEKERKRAALEKKKPKMNNFDDAAIVDDYIPPRPSQYALDRLEVFDFVELWYFTLEGYADAVSQPLSWNEDAFGPSKNVIPDSKLSFRQLSMAKHALIRLMRRYQWSEEVVNTFVQFFTQIEIHPYWQRDYGEQALLMYQARARREWHDQMKLGNSFDIGHINESLLRDCYREIVEKAGLSFLNEVSIIFCFFAFNILTLSLSISAILLR